GAGHGLDRDRLAGGVGRAVAVLRLRLRVDGIHRTRGVAGRAARRCSAASAMNGIFVTGTDTGIGKTLASCALLHALRARGLHAVGMKPLASGCEATPGGLRNEDALALQADSDPRPADARSGRAARRCSAASAMNGIFVTGTDTGIGKTLASCALLHALRARGLHAVGMKPLASGCEATPGGLRNEDALALQADSDPRPAYA